jgi:hypothetical protein
MCHSMTVLITSDYNRFVALNHLILGLVMLDEGVGFLEQLQKLRVEGTGHSPPRFSFCDSCCGRSGCPALRQPPREIVMLGPHTLHDYCSRVRNSATTGILDLTGVPVKRLPAAALHPNALHTLLLADSLIEVAAARARAHRRDCSKCAPRVMRWLC